MPELPEMEALAAVLRERAVGKVVARAEPVAINALRTVSPAPADLLGATLADAGRRGKFLDLVFATPTGERLDLVAHLARAGWLRWKDSQPAAPGKGGRSGLAWRLVFTDGSGFDLTEAGTQKRLAVYLVRDPAEVPGVARLGIDPFDDAFTTDALAGLLAAAGRGQLKGVLTDQSVLAGVGNAYSDEALWAARLSPFAPANSLSAEKVTTLHGALVGVLRAAVEAAGGLGAADLKAEKKANLAVHGRTGQPCPRCGETVRQVAFADRSLQYCPACQTGGRVLADRRLSRLLK
ncbi:Fpg/Nei family DNA glycosylase [Frankia sp. CNm7]|uniref:Fpg/Nei family DNA glycosylase n=1 Tax=Frankia nepalensis TaxID=1836974 RepID=A0A937UR56_9ACTN|nr:DNA-formamidopyrimidine glycosylase family protein [Frankia nepalensis]MBL7502247.1 Fpg/Nei family DNA glycosylase [Frankia nepalensis]MBL7515936.1 Fpg/Nei family DNA glycosylase [Frankia nepalensis]MBL7519013.1 Fpg/Nei family DNA glycosylase [Frankia nepalensis]MBL7632519.1 Fpg/Nei family DNA glycosylase [Frankia nepalensis]